MVHTKSHRKHGRRHTKRRMQKGGSGGAAGWMERLVGPENVQFKNVFSGSSGANSNSSNTIKPLHQKGGGRSKKGGYWAEVINTAAVPLALFGMQRHLGKRSRRKH